MRACHDGAAAIIKKVAAPFHICRTGRANFFIGSRRLRKKR